MEEELLRFFEISGKLKCTIRSGWSASAGIEKPESVADHTFRCAIMAMTIGDLEALETNKLVKMLMLHDLQEALTGDFDAFAKQKLGLKEIKIKQKNAIKEITSLLPNTLRSRYLALWDEYENKITKEALLANDIDKIEMLLQALEYEKQGCPSAKLDTFWNSSKPQIKTPIGKKWLSGLEQKRALIHKTLNPGK
jgi:putative hydrolase of HD superfamily